LLSYKTRKLFFLGVAQNSDKIKINNEKEIEKFEYQFGYSGKGTPFLNDQSIIVSC